MYLNKHDVSYLVVIINRLIPAEKKLNLQIINNRFPDFMCFLKIFFRRLKNRNKITAISGYR